MKRWVFGNQGLTPDVRAGLVPAPCGATTKVAPHEILKTGKGQAILADLGEGRLC